jgi:cytochrome c oxidase cbb3-type subunit I
MAAHGKHVQLKGHPAIRDHGRGLGRGRDAGGVFIAAQLLWPALNFDVPWLSYGRLRPLHTNAVIFAFGGSALFATSYYVVQRTSHARLFSDGLAAFTFWGWQAVIVLAAVTLPLGITSGKEYAELEWPIDLLIAAVWVAYAVVFFACRS